MSASRISISPDEDLAVVFRWMSGKTVWREVSDIERVAPLTLTVPAHGVPDGWPVSLSFRNPHIPDLSDRASVLSDDRIALPNINGSKTPPCERRTYLRYLAPVDLSGVRLAARLCGNERLGVTPTIDGTRIRVLVPRAKLRRLGGQFQLDLDATDAAGRKMHLANYAVTRDCRRRDFEPRDAFVVSAGEQGVSGAGGFADRSAVRVTPQLFSDAERAQAQQNLDLPWNYALLFQSSLL